MSKLRLVFGGMVPELAVQAERQGFVIENAAHEQKKANAIFLLNIHGVITDGEAHKARQRLMKKMKFDEVKP